MNFNWSLVTWSLRKDWNWRENKWKLQYIDRTMNGKNYIQIIDHAALTPKEDPIILELSF